MAAPPPVAARCRLARPYRDALGAADQAVNGILIALAVVALLAAGGAWMLAEVSAFRWVSELTGAAIAFGRRDLEPASA